MSVADIRALRERLNMTQQQFAAELGTTVPTVSRWENGAREPRGLYAKALANLAATAPAPPVVNLEQTGKGSDDRP